LKARGVSQGVKNRRENFLRLKAENSFRRKKSKNSKRDCSIPFSIKGRRMLLNSSSAYQANV